MQCSVFKQQLAITSKRSEIGCQLLLITNRKLHTVFRLVPTSVTLNGIIALTVLYFTEFYSFPGLSCYSGWRWTFCLQNIVLHFRPQLTHLAARSLCDSWAISQNSFTSGKSVKLATIQYITLPTTPKISCHTILRNCGIRIASLHTSSQCL